MIPIAVAGSKGRVATPLLDRGRSDGKLGRIYGRAPPHSRASLAVRCARLIARNQEVS
ncbi:MAG: hypothetical protein JO288_00735 [Hyphomicrobiales bacterium]|nr:hypothetical protein [Hyphomicrobiales bacterium]